MDTVLDNFGHCSGHCSRLFRTLFPTVLDTVSDTVPNNVPDAPFFFRGASMITFCYMAATAEKQRGVPNTVSDTVPDTVPDTFQNLFQTCPARVIWNVFRSSQGQFLESFLEAFLEPILEVKSLMGRLRLFAKQSLIVPRTSFHYSRGRRRLVAGADCSKQLTVLKVVFADPRFAEAAMFVTDLVTQP